MVNIEYLLTPILDGLRQESLAVTTALFYLVFLLNVLGGGDCWNYLVLDWYLSG